MEKKIVKNLTEREELELIDKLEKSSNQELGKLAKFVLRLNSDPFEAGARKYELPSITRKTVLTALKLSIKRGEVPVAKINA